MGYKAGIFIGKLDGNCDTFPGAGGGEEGEAGAHEAQADLKFTA